MSQPFEKPVTAPPTIFMCAVLAGLGIGWVWPWPLLPLWLQVSLGPALVGAGVLTIRQSMREIAAAETTYDPYDVSTALVTGGVYRYSRNPGYLGLAVIQCGLAVLLDNGWLWLTGVLAVAATTWFVIRLEERKLGDAFGAAYAAYCARVRRWL